LEHLNPKKIKEQLQREILMRNGLQAAKLWSALRKSDPRFVFPPTIQFDLCRLLVVGGHPTEAISAFEMLLKHHPHAPISQAARLEAARLCAPLPDYRFFAIECLRDFQAASPADALASEAQQMLDQIQLAAAGVTSPLQHRHQGDRAEDIPSSQRLDQTPTAEISLPPATSPRAWKSVATSPEEALALLPPTPTPPAPFAFVAASEPASETPVPEPSPMSAVQAPPFIPSPPPNVMPLFTFSPAQENNNAPENVSPLASPPSLPVPDLLAQSLELPPELLMEAPVIPSADRVPEIPPPPSGPIAPIPELPVAAPEAKQDAEKAPAKKSQRLPTEEFDHGTRILEMEKFRREQAEREKTREYQKILSESWFSVLLPPGKKIHFEETCNLVAGFLEMDSSLARRKIRSGKGVVLSDLSYDDMISFYRLLVDTRQKFLFVRQEGDIFNEPIEEILSARREDKAIRLTTQRAQFRIPWAPPLLLSAGNVRENRQTPQALGMADLYLREPGPRHLRLYDTTFNFRSWGAASASIPEQFRELLLSWKKLFPKAVVSHTIETLAKSDAATLQVFETILEYEQYNRWLLLSHFGDRVDPSKLHSDLPPSL
jgi:hypothetical protein